MIIVDWEEGAKSPNYLSAVKNAKECGKKVGDFIINNNINSKFVHCIGILILHFQYHLSNKLKNAFL